MWTIFRKELLEVFRDRRTLILMLVVPGLIVPLLIGGFSFLAKSRLEQESRRVYKYAVFNAPDSPSFDQRLSAMPQMRRVEWADPATTAKAIKEEKLDFVVTIPKGTEQRIAGGDQVNITLQYNAATSADIIGKRMKALIADWGDELRSQALASRGLDQHAQKVLAKPVTLTINSTANDRERLGEMVGAMLPYFLLIFGIQAAMVCAMDMGAGEKERGTLESLLLLPVPRSQLVLAKFLAVGLVGCATSLFTVISLALWATGLLRGSGMNDLVAIISSITMTDFALIAMLILPAMAIISSLLLVLSFHARSVKEASTYGAQVMMLAIVPIMLSMLPDMRLDAGWAWVPLTNISLAVKEIIKGTLGVKELAIVMSSTVLVASALLFACKRWCEREEVLFRS
ncbi:ABC transporter permease [Burkholderiaceae bacterium DAT-1]|nr:ABC transporter permease [Burkholderiaceae bacterium DAT-1]